MSGHDRHDEPISADDHLARARELLARAQTSSLPQERAKYLGAAQRWYALARTSSALRTVREAQGRPIGAPVRPAPAI